MCTRWGSRGTLPAALGSDSLARFVLTVRYADASTLDSSSLAGPFVEGWGGGSRNFSDTFLAAVKCRAPR